MTAGYAVRAEGLSKRYRLGLGASAPGLLSQRLSSKGKDREWLWALEDVSFEVAQGDAVGIIGRNGAGKTTLLKILSRITEPTRGEVRLRGRVGALLEVGTGFHPELTGMENIYLNGAILGMRRSEIDRKLEEIIGFAEISRFIDTPVKRYSSGMFVRLAFAVAAHLEPEVLIVDEVLSVGDAAFQRRCMGKMNDVASEGRTVLFVSHNLIAVQRLCTSGIVLESGRVAFSGSVSDCVDRYLAAPEQGDRDTGQIDLSNVDQGGSGEVRFTTLTILDSKGAASTKLAIGEPFDVLIRFETGRSFSDLIVGLGVHGTHDVPLFSTHWNDSGGEPLAVEAGSWETRVRIEPNHLRHGTYTISLGAISRGELVGRLETAASFDIEELVHSRDLHYDARIGYFFVPMRWDAPVPTGDGS